MVLTDVVDASVVHLVTRPVDTSQQPPQPSQRDRLPNGGAGQFTANMMGAQGMGVPMDMNDFGSVSSTFSASTFRCTPDCSSISSVEFRWKYFVIR